MPNPVRQYAKVRENRAKILTALHEFLSDTVQSSYTSKGHRKLGNGDTIETKQSGRGSWFEIELSSLDSDGWVDRYLESDDAITQFDLIKSEAPDAPVTVTVDKCDMTYGVGNSGLWSTKQLFSVMDRLLESILELGASRDFVRERVSEMEAGLIQIGNTEVSKSSVMEFVLARDVDAVETLTAVSVPDSVSELRRNSKQGFGDNFPPVIRSFLLNSESIGIEYSDDSICLIRGSTEKGYDMSVLIGVDDGGAFYHPVPRSLRVDNPQYEVQRSDVRELMAYDEDWSRGDDIEENKWLRVQGDLLLKHIPRKDVVENYQQIALCQFVDDAITKEFLKNTELWPLDGQVKFKVVNPASLPKITVSYPSGPARRTIEQDVKRIMGWSDDVDAGYKLVEKLIDWILDNYNVASEAETNYSNELKQSQQASFATQLDNHLVMLKNASPEPDSQSVYDNLMADDGRDYTYFGVKDSGSMNIQHNEHDPVPINLQEGGYILTLAMRRNR